MRRLLPLFLVLALSPSLGGQTSTLLFEENFTSDNSVNGQSPVTQLSLAGRGWKDGTSSIGTGYKNMLDPTLHKNVLYAHWATPSSGSGDIQQPDGDASAIKKFFTGTPDATMYAVVKFHNIAGSNMGAHWVRFFNNPSFGEFSPANANGQIDLDVSGKSQNSWLYDPTTKVATNPATQTKGFFLYSGGSLSYATKGRDNLWADDVWYEVVWYVKASSSGSSPTANGDGQMRVYVRPLGTPAWVSAFDGANFVNTLYPGGLIKSWMIGPYLSGGSGTPRWTSDIRQYFSRVVVWSGDAYANGTLAAFLGNQTPPTPTLCTDPAATNNGQPLPCLYPPPTPTPVVDCRLEGRKSATTTTVTWKQIPASGGGKPCPAVWVIK